MPDIVGATTSSRLADAGSLAVYTCDKGRLYHQSDNVTLECDGEYWVGAEDVECEGQISLL